jgi:hypothetical protein
MQPPPAPLRCFSSFPFFLPTQSDLVVNYSLLLLLAAETGMQHANTLDFCFPRAGLMVICRLKSSPLVLDRSYDCTLLTRDQH